MKTGKRLALLALESGTEERRMWRPGHSIGLAERNAVLEVIESGLLSGFVAEPGDEFLGGPRVRQLEDALCEYFGSAYAVTFNSATSALHASLAAAGVRVGDEVITSPYSMVASASAIILQGAVPVFGDVESETYCIEPAEVKRKMTSRTRVVMPVNLYGQPADLEAIAAAAPSAVLIEDNAQALGAKYRERYAGTVGRIGVLSFNRHKVVQCGEGGAALTDDEDMAMRLRLARNHGEAVVPGLDDPDSYCDAIGGNYRLTELQAAVALAQFRRLDELNRHRREIAEYLDEALAPFDFLRCPVVRNGCTHVYFFYAMRYERDKLGVSRDTIVRAIRAEGLDARGGHYKPIYLYPLYQERPSSFHGVRCPTYDGKVEYSAGSCPVAERLYSEEVLLTKIVQYPTPLSEARRFVEVMERIADSVAELKRFERV